MIKSLLFKLNLNKKLFNSVSHITQLKFKHLIIIYNVLNLFILKLLNQCKNKHKIELNEKADLTE